MSVAPDGRIGSAIQVNEAAGALLLNTDAGEALAQRRQEHLERILAAHSYVYGGLRVRPVAPGATDARIIVRAAIAAGDPQREPDTRTNALQHQDEL